MNDQRVVFGLVLTVTAYFAVVVTESTIAKFAGKENVRVFQLTQESLFFFGYIAVFVLTYSGYIFAEEGFKDFEAGPLFLFQLLAVMISAIVFVRDQGELMAEVRQIKIERRNKKRR